MMSSSKSSETLPEMFRDTKWKRVKHSIEGTRGNVRGPIVAIGDDKLAILAAWGDVQVLDLDTNKLTQLSPMPAPFRRFGCSAVALKNRLYVFGGFSNKQEYGDALNIVDMLDLQTNEWTRVGRMPAPMEGRCSAAVVDDDRIALVGGQNRDDSSRADNAFLFHVGNGSWSQMPNMHKSRCKCAAVVANDKLYAIGGEEGNGNDHDGESTMEMFDFSTENWTLLPPIKGGRRVGCAAVAVDGCIVVCGGNNGTKIRKSVQVFQTSTQTWSDLPDIFAGMRQIMCRSAAIVGSRIAILGGSRDGLVPLDVVEMMIVNPYHLIVSKKLIPLMRQDNLPLGLWSHVMAKCPPSAINFILCSGTLAVNSVLLKPSF